MARPGNFSKIFDPPKIIKIAWKRGLGPRALNSACPEPPRVLSGAMEDGIEAIFGHFSSGPGQLLAGQSFRKPQYPHPGAGAQTTPLPYPHPGAGAQPTPWPYPHPGAGTGCSNFVPAGQNLNTLSRGTDLEQFPQFPPCTTCSASPRGGGAGVYEQRGVPQGKGEGCTDL